MGLEPNALEMLDNADHLNYNEATTFLPIVPYTK
jgi:hypothetical protein